jgi:hypothetical protein
MTPLRQQMTPRPSAPFSARINALATRPCSTPLLQPSNGSPKTSDSSGRTSLVSPGSCPPGEDSCNTILHYIVPGGGLSKDRTTWRPSRAHFFVPVKALSPIYRALFKEDISQAGLLEQIAPQVWTIPWNVPSQANLNAPAALTYLAPYVCKVAIANSPIVSLTDRPVTFTYRRPGSAHPRTTALDVMEFLRRFLQQVLPEGFMKVRHFGFLHASCPIPPDTLRQMLVQAHPIAGKPTRSVPPQPLVAWCPTCGAPMHLVMRLGTSNKACVDTS